jgi:hypothetical protein
MRTNIQLLIAYYPTKRNTQTELKKAAVKYSILGIRFVPLRIQFNGKKFPIFDSGWKSSRYTHKSIKEHHNALAIKTGARESTVFHIDIDICGLALKKFLGYYQIELRDFVHYYTPSGGVHIMLSTKHNSYWLKHFGRKTLTTTNSFIHVDVRDEGSLAFCPPTEIPDYGPYSWGRRPYCLEDFDYKPASIETLMFDIYGKVKGTKVAPQPKAVRRIYLENGDQNDWMKAQSIVAILSQLRIDYRDWVKVGMALYAGFGEQGKALWDMFLTNPNYSDTQRLLDAHWYSFRSVNRVTLASLFYVAAKYGITQ